MAELTTQEKSTHSPAPRPPAMTGTASNELNTPLPRWWLWTFYVTIIWAIGYWIVYPAWPLLTSATEGRVRLAFAQRGGRRSQQLKALRGPMMDKLTNASVEEIANDPQLLDFARAQGRVAFADNCAPCHGAGGGGGKGYPDLNDDDWLWGGKLEDIERHHSSRRARRRR